MKNYQCVNPILCVLINQMVLLLVCLLQSSEASLHIAFESYKIDEKGTGIFWDTTIIHALLLLHNRKMNLITKFLVTSYRLKSCIHVSEHKTIYDLGSYAK